MVEKTSNHFEELNYFLLLLLFCAIKKMYLEMLKLGPRQHF